MIEEYSGIVYSNNVPANSVASLGTVYQTFTLPDDYVRGSQTDSPAVPYLTGFQVSLMAADSNVTLPWTIQHLDSTGNWDTISSGSVTQAPIVDNEFWINIFSDELITIDPIWVNDTFRFGIGIDGDTIPQVYTVSPNPLAAQNLESYIYSNMVPNPSFAHDITGHAPAGWLAEGAATLTVTSTPSLEISTAGTEEGTDVVVPITGEFFAGFTYTLTLQAKGQAGGEQVAFILGSTDIDQGSTALNLTTSYEPVTVTWIPRSNANKITIGITSDSSNVQNFFIQKVMVNAGPSTTYVDGDTTGYSWSGQIGNSPTVQTQGSLLFSILALVADNGFDILGNSYRSNVVPHLIGNVNTETSPDGTNLSWISRPNPSSQAIEAIYVDISDSSGSPTVFDSILLDPITQGVYFNVYYSSDGVPVTEVTEWDNKLWTHVPYEFTMTKRDTYVMPRAVIANYVKIEFTNLQGQSYSPKGSPSVIYNKFPSWVYFYFLLQILPPRLGEDYFIGGTDSVVFDYLDFAYNYYTGDAIQSSSLPAPVVEQIQYEINQANTQSSALDPITLGQINSDLAPYQKQPILSAPSNYLPSISASDLGTYSQIVNYSTEAPFPSFAAQPLTNNGNYVSSRLKDGLIQEVTLPQMYFWQICRHSYKQIQANFTNNRAYYVGIRELGFLRQNFNVPVDTPVYYETFGDSFNQITC